MATKRTAMGSERVTEARGQGGGNIRGGVVIETHSNKSGGSERRSLTRPPPKPPLPKKKSNKSADLLAPPPGQLATANSARRMEVGQPPRKLKMADICKANLASTRGGQLP